MLMAGTPKIYPAVKRITPMVPEPMKARPSVAIQKNRLVPTAATLRRLSHMIPTIGPVIIIIRDMVETMAVAPVWLCPAITIVGIPCCSMELETITARVQDMNASHVIGFFRASPKLIPVASAEVIAASSFSSRSPIRLIFFSAGLHTTALSAISRHTSTHAARVKYPACQLTLRTM